MKLIQTGRDRIVWGTLGLGTAALTAMLARQAMQGGWRALRTDEPPDNPISRDTTWGDALLWTVAMAIGAGVTRLVVERLAAQVWHHQTGRKPPGL